MPTFSIRRLWTNLSNKLTKNTKRKWERNSEKEYRGHPFREFVILPIRLYRRWISPMFPPCCRFTPTCSQYTIEAVRTHGILRGLALSCWRILRCNPWSRGGYDPVPPKH